MADLPPSVALGTVRSTNATGASNGLMRWSRVDSDIPRRMVSPTLGAAMPSLGGRWSARGTSRVACPERAAADAGLQPTAEHAVVALYPHSTDQMSCLGAAEMGQATRRELALGLRSAEASLAATRGRSRWRRGGAGARETQRRRLPSALGALDLLSRLGPRAVTASMLRRSLPFQPTLLAISYSDARARRSITLLVH